MIEQILQGITLDWHFFSGILSIIIIDIILAGDNAVIIAMAVRSLPKNLRLKGIIFGSAVAVALRVVLTFFTAQLIQISFLKLIGGILVAWIAVKLFIEGPGDESLAKEGTTFFQAIRIIVVADFIMSLDNVLAVAGASKGNLFLLIFGLVASIPLVIGTSTLITSLMDRFPVIIYIGAGLLGKVAGEMIMTDPYVHSLLKPDKWLIYTAEAVFIAGVIIIGRLMLNRRRQIARKEIEALENT